MRVVVPFGVRDPVTRLDPVLSEPERRAFALRMLADVIRAVRGAGGEPEILAEAPIEPAFGEDGAGNDPLAAVGVDIPVSVDERPLTAAVNAELAAADWREGREKPLAIVMADLALATPRAIDRLRTDADLVIVPGRGGGTNALLVDQPGFRVDYHGASYLDHLRTADELDATVRTVDSMRLSTDIDEPDDLVELLLHGEGVAADWLEDAGFELRIREGRVGVERS